MIVRKTEIHTVTITTDYNVPNEAIGEEYTDDAGFIAALKDPETSGAAKTFAETFTGERSTVWDKEGRGTYDIIWGYQVDIEEVL